MLSSSDSLAAYGWTPYFQAQLSLEEIPHTTPARVTTVHRGAWQIAAPGLDTRIEPLPAFSRETFVTTGDWLILDRATHRPLRLLNRHSLFQRRAAGVDAVLQPIAANVDTAFVVSSCNQDFNAARLERYLVLARDAEVTPVVVLTKADLCETAGSDPASYRRIAEGLLPGLVVVCVNALSPASTAELLDWCAPGQTITLLGSSGVGKSTLANTLRGIDDQATGEIREDDAKGRHTTTARALLQLPSGGWLLDTPGMRELQLADAADGIDAVFQDIILLAQDCRFKDCSHDTEPGCAVHEAIENGKLEHDRLLRYRKLVAEERINSETIAERRARDKSFGKLYKSVKKEMTRRGKH